MFPPLLTHVNIRTQAQLKHKYTHSADGKGSSLYTSPLTPLFGASQDTPVSETDRKRRLSGPGHSPLSQSPSWRWQHGSAFLL